MTKEKREKRMMELVRRLKRSLFFREAYKPKDPKEKWDSSTKQHSADCKQLNNAIRHHEKMYVKDFGEVKL